MCIPPPLFKAVRFSSTSSQPSNATDILLTDQVGITFNPFSIQRLAVLKDGVTTSMFKPASFIKDIRYEIVLPPPNPIIVLF